MIDDWIYLIYPVGSEELLPNCRYSLVRQTIQVWYQTQWYNLDDSNSAGSFREEIMELVRARR